MATFAICVRKRNRNNLYAVYISVNHHSKVGYIKTDKVVTDKDVKGRQVTNSLVLSLLSSKILDYQRALNAVDSSGWTTSQIIAYLQLSSEDVCFSEYARGYINRMIDKAQERNARNYSLALDHLERYLGTNRVMVSHLTSSVLTHWIESLAETHRAKEMYPICMRQVYKQAILDCNDEEQGIVRIKGNPWLKVTIPRADAGQHRAITAEACREFFSFALPESRLRLPLTEMGRDVAMMVLCLAGINTVDLYLMRKIDYYDGILHYKRAKTSKGRSDGAYMEIRVPGIIANLIDKYYDDSESEFLFVWHNNYASSDSFGAAVNSGLRQVCKLMGIKHAYCVYTFRHTWATIAQNDCGATIDEVAFGLNHSQGHQVTRGYIKIDFTPAWLLNERVVEFVFASDAPSKRQTDKDTRKVFNLTHRTLVHAVAYHRGRAVAELQDIGYRNTETICDELMSRLPADMPTRTMIVIKITDVDRGLDMIAQKFKK